MVIKYMKINENVIISIRVFQISFSFFQNVCPSRFFKILTCRFLKAVGDLISMLFFVAIKHLDIQLLSDLNEGNSPIYYWISFSPFPFIKESFDVIMIYIRCKTEENGREMPSCRSRE